MVSRLHSCSVRLPSSFPKALFWNSQPRKVADFPTYQASLTVLFIIKLSIKFLTNFEAAIVGARYQL